MADKQKHKTAIVPVDAQQGAVVAKAELKTLMFKAKKIFLGYEEGDNPELEPTFANHFELFMIGSDSFLDIGVIKPEELAASATRPGETTPETIAELNFYVTHRVAMSRDTFLRLHQKISEIHKVLEQINANTISGKTN